MRKLKIYEKIIYMSVVIGVIVPSIYIWYSLYISKYEDNSWTIGVGLFGTLSGGICTLIAVVISTQETRRVQAESMQYNNKQLRIAILNEQIKDYKNTKDKLNDICRKIADLYYLEPFQADNIGQIRKILSVNNNYKQHAYELIKLIEDDFSSYLACICDAKTEAGLSSTLNTVCTYLSLLCYSDNSNQVLEIVKNIHNKTSNINEYMSLLQNQIKSLYFAKYFVGESNKS